jgi:hypothetical protein
VIECPDGLDEDGLADFMYLQACYNLRARPGGYFENGDAKICAEVMGRGGDIVEMFRSGADPLYAALLSNPDIDEETMRKVIKEHAPF